MLSEAWGSLREANPADLGNGALERITKVLEDLKYNPNEEFAIFAKDAGELGMENVLSHLPSNLGMRDLVSFRNFLKLMVQQHWITEASPAEKPVSGDSQPQLSLSSQDQVLNLSKILAATVAGFPY